MQPTSPVRKFVVNGESFNDMVACQGLVDCNIYTDGSKIDDKVGAGIYIIYDGARVTEIFYGLVSHTTVFQAEAMAIQDAACVTQIMPTLTHFKFFVDSHSALRALQNPMIHSKLILQTIHDLNLITALSITFVWTKAHISIAGNEKVDKMAKAGTELPDDQILITTSSTCMVKSTIKEKIQEIWNKEWLAYLEARQSKLFVPTADVMIASLIIKLSRLKLGQYIRAKTGHKNLLYHLHNIEPHNLPSQASGINPKTQDRHLDALDESESPSDVLVMDAI